MFNLLYIYIYIYIIRSVNWSLFNCTVIYNICNLNNYTVVTKNKMA